jgi:hypothetical protein
MKLMVSSTLCGTCRACRDLDDCLTNATLLCGKKSPSADTKDNLENHAISNITLSSQITYPMLLSVWDGIYAVEEAKKPIVDEAAIQTSAVQKLLRCKTILRWISLSLQSRNY